MFVEIGPDGTLSALGPAALGEDADPVFVPVLRPGHPAPVTVTAALARVHARGVAVDWDALLGGGQRVALPTYAFQHQWFWPKPPPRDPAETAGDRTGAWRYRITWAPAAEPDRVALPGTWLMLTPAGRASELAEGCLRALAARGAQVVVAEVAAGELDRHVLATLIGHVAASGISEVSGISGVSGVISLLALDETPLPGHRVVPAGLAGTLALVQALGDAGIDAPLWLLTRGAVAAEPGEVLASPVQGMTWGLGRVAAQEYPDRPCGLVDLPPVLDDDAAARLCAVLAPGGLARVGGPSGLHQVGWSRVGWPRVGWQGAARTRWRSGTPG